MVGLILNRPARLSEILFPLAEELENHFWIVDIQSGPFQWGWISQPENDAKFEAHLWEIARLESTSARGLRPGLLPRLADELILDEWSYYFAVDANERTAVQRADRIKGKHNYIAMIEELGRVADLFVMYVDGWWEIYCTGDEWRSRLKKFLPGLHERDSALAGRPPESTSRKLRSR